MVHGLETFMLDHTTLVSSQFCAYINLSFTGCKEKISNKNLYAMMLPPLCTAYSIQPKGKVFLSNSNIWASTDGGDSHVVMCLSIDW